MTQKKNASWKLNVVRIIVALSFVLAVLMIKYGFFPATATTVGHRTPYISTRTISYELVKNVCVTVYHSTAKECGNNKGITYSGRKCRPGTAAVSFPLLFCCLNSGDTIIPATGDPAFDSLRLIVDDTGPLKTTRNVVEIWQPIGSGLKGCYKNAAIKIIRRNGKL